MRGELIIVGDEVLDGRVLNVNGRRLAARLASAGLPVSRITTVGDESEVLGRVLAHAARLADFVLVTGGLGHTDDDLTTAVAAESFDRPLTLHEGVLERIASVCRKRGREMGRLERLAWLPRGAEPLAPEEHFCGFHLVQDRCLLFFLPGVPEEVLDLFDRKVLPRLMARFSDRPFFRQRTVKLLGLTESEVSARLQGLARDHPQVALGSYPNFPEVHLSLTVKGKDEAGLETALDRMEEDLKTRLGPYIIGRDRETLPRTVGRLLTERGLTLATAESCTGGRAAQMITSVPGSSAYFIQGVVTYANGAKESLLGVDPRDLRDYGAVSSRVAAAMAQGLRERAGVDLTVSVTGIAGPDGGREDKPVGTVFFGLASADRVQVEKRKFIGPRRWVQVQAAAWSLNMIRRYLTASEQ